MAQNRLLIASAAILLSVSACSTGNYGNSLQGSYNSSYGRGVQAVKDRDYEQAAIHYSFAAKSGHPKALVAYGQLFAFGQGVERDPVRAQQLLEDAYGKSSSFKSKAAYVLGRVLLDGGEGPSGTLEADPPRGRALLVEALEGGQTRAAASLGRLYDRGIGVDADMKKAIVYYEQASKTDMTAARRLPYLLAETGASKERVEAAAVNAADKLKSRAEQGDDKAWIQLADLYMNEDIMDPNPEQALAYLKNLPEGDNPAVLTRLASLYGEVGDRDQERKTLRRAADIGDKKAQTELAKIYLKSGTRDSNGPVGRYYAEKAIAQDSKDAMVYLGAALMIGKVLEPDLTIGETLLRRASDADSNRAHVMLGLSVLRNQIRPRFPGEAQQLLEKAAENGSTAAMTALGFAYHSGDGLPQNSEAAQRWLQRAADAGHAKAKQFLDEQAGA